MHYRSRTGVGGFVQQTGNFGAVVDSELAL